MNDRPEVMLPKKRGDEIGIAEVSLDGPFGQGRGESAVDAEQVEPQLRQPGADCPANKPGRTGDEYHCWPL